jgi:EmrB/QacA subfamily drug resistance transporter
MTEATGGPDQGHPAQMSHRQITNALAGLLTGMFMAILSGTVVATALPRIITELDGSQAAYTWVVTATLLATTASTPIWGKLADLTDKKRLIQLALLVFLVSSLLAGLAQNTAQLIACRVLQGIGAGGLTALVQVIIAAMIAPRERGRYMGYIGAVMAAGTVGGPLLGGFIVDTPWLGWRWCFFIGAPFALLAILVLRKTLQLPVVTRRVRIDYAGAVVIVAAVSLLLLWVTFAGENGKYPWVSWQTAVMLGGTVLLTALAVLIESRAAEPIIPLRLFRSRTVTLATTASVSIGLALFGTTVFLTLYFQISLGRSPTAAGLMTLPMVAGLLVCATVVGRLITRTGVWKRYLLLGAASLTAGLALMSTIDAHTDFRLLSLYMVLVGAGIGMTMQNLVLAVQNVVELRNLGAASSVVTFFRSLGGALGVSVLGAALGNVVRGYITEGLARLGLPTHTAPGSGGKLPDLATLPAPVRVVVQDAYGHAVGDLFLVAVPFALIALVAICFIPEIPLRRHSPLAAPPAGPTRAATGD